MNVTQAGVTEGFAPTSGNYFFLKDGLGSITEITNSTGQVVQNYFYSSFGKIFKIENGGIDNTANPNIKSPFTYTNREYDSESGLYYYRARYYDAHVGRFLQEDPYPGAQIFPTTLNQRYSYVLNSPINRTDPTGELDPITIAAIIGAVVAGVMHVDKHGLEFSLNSVGSLAGAMTIGAIVGAGGYAAGSLGGYYGAKYLAIGGSKVLGAFLGSFTAGFIFSSAQQGLTTGEVSLGKAAITGFFFGAGGMIGEAVKGLPNATIPQNIDTINKSAIEPMIPPIGPTIKMPELY